MTNQEIKDRAPDWADMKIEDLAKMLLESKVTIDGKTYKATSVQTERELIGGADIKVNLIEVRKPEKITITGSGVNIDESHINEALKLNNLG